MRYDQYSGRQESKVYVYECSHVYMNLYGHTTDLWGAAEFNRVQAYNS